MFDDKRLKMLHNFDDVSFQKILQEVPAPARQDR